MMPPLKHCLTDWHRLHLGLTHDDAFRISMAGAQEKTALLRA